MTTNVRSIHVRWIAIAVGALALVSSLASLAQNSPEGTTGVSRQPLIVGLAVDLPTQKARGLITVMKTIPGPRPPGRGILPSAATCSGTLINRYWVLTADHCVTADGKVGGPDLAASAFTLSAAWSARRPVPTKIVRVGRPHGRDVALIFLGAGDFGAAPTQQLSAQAVTDESTILKYGRGVSAYAQKGPPPVPSVSDGQYRQANMLVSDVEGGDYTVSKNGTKQQSAGGDSGGPDWIVAPDGRNLVAIAGVSSRGEAEYLDGMPREWKWVTNVDDSTSAGIWGLRNEILEIVEPLSVEFCKDYATRAVAASTTNTRLQCGGVGGRWSAVQTEHLNWCIDNRLNTDPANDESRARVELLQSCVSSRCNDYAKLAIAAADEHVAKKCEGGGPRWSRESGEHVSWCVSIGGDSAALNAENDLRNSALLTCRDNLRLRRNSESLAEQIGRHSGTVSGNATIEAPRVSVISPNAPSSTTISICQRAADARKRNSPAAAQLAAKCLAEGGTLESGSTGPDLNALAVEGEALAANDALATLLRESLAEGETRRGFDIAMAAAKGQTEWGPGKQRILDSLGAAAQAGFRTAISYLFDLNRYAARARIGAQIAEADSEVAERRGADGDARFTLGFDIATAIFGDPARGAQGNTAAGPGSLGIRNALSAPAQRGFDDAMKFHLNKTY